MPSAPPKWKFEPKPESFAQGVACCDVVNRGVAVWKGKVFVGTIDPGKAHGISKLQGVVSVVAIDGTEIFFLILVGGEGIGDLAFDDGDGGIAEADFV